MEKTRILIADDQPHIFSIIDMSINKSKYDLFYVKNGVEVLKKVGEINPHIIIMDIQMPEMDGYTASMKLKEDPHTSKIPIIILTVREEKIYKTVSNTIGAVFHMTKPFDPDELEEKIESILKLK
ncbi:MAG: response regulator [bacterium]|nr:response regulator [bacterium]